MSFNCGVRRSECHCFRIRMPCEEKQRLVVECEAATRKLSEAVSEFQPRMGTSSSSEYERLSRAADEARVKSEQAPSGQGALRRSARIGSPAISVHLRGHLVARWRRRQEHMAEPDGAGVPSGLPPLVDRTCQLPVSPIPRSAGVYRGSGEVALKSRNTVVPAGVQS